MRRRSGGSQMFESVREFLVDAAAGTGLLVVLDDLHWADPPSLRLLRHLAAGIGTARLLVLATYRDTESAGRDEFRALLAALAREDAVSRIRLAGLTQDEVACQLAAITGSQVAPEVAAAVSRRTHGNPSSSPSSGGFWFGCQRTAGGGTRCCPCPAGRPDARLPGRAVPRCGSRRRDRPIRCRRGVPSVI